VSETQAPVRRSFIEPPGLRIAGASFRPITEADMPFLCALYAQVRRDELAPVPWPDEVKQAFLRSQFQLQHAHYHQHNPKADFLLIERDGAPIGRIYVNRAPRDIRIMEVSLLESERGRGLGTLLFAEIFAEARASGSRVSLHVEPNNPAMRLYQRLGFKIIERGGVYWYLECALEDQLNITS
jgi:ribosomal protein S18 acetylase RimI-like enzyme